LEVISMVTNLLRLKARESEVQAFRHQVSESAAKRHLPAKLAAEILKGSMTFDLEAQKYTATVLLAEVCDFAAATDALAPKAIATVLNEFLLAATEIVFDQEGLVDKCVGEGVVALFGVAGTQDPKAQAERAAATGAALLHRIEELNEQWSRQNLPRLALRIGVHLGPVVFSHFGGTRRSDFSAVGPTVHLTSRILAQASPGEILMSASVAQHLAQESQESLGLFALAEPGGEKISLSRLRVGTRSHQAA